MVHRAALCALGLLLAALPSSLAAVRRLGSYTYVAPSYSGSSYSYSYSYGYAGGNYGVR